MQTYVHYKTTTVFRTCPSLNLKQETNMYATSELILIVQYKYSNNYVPLV